MMYLYKRTFIELKVWKDWDLVQRRIISFCLSFSFLFFFLFLAAVQWLDVGFQFSDQGLNLGHSCESTESQALDQQGTFQEKDFFSFKERNGKLRGLTSSGHLLCTRYIVML